MPTPNLNLTLPTEGGSEDTWGGLLNDALTDIDTWALRCSFGAARTTTDSNATGAGTVSNVAFTTEHFDYGGNFSANVFTAPVDGTYQFNAEVALGGLTPDMTDRELRLVTTGGVFSVNPKSVPMSGGQDALVLSELVQMTAGHTAYVTIQASGGVGDTADVIGARFSGFLVR